MQNRTELYIIGSGDTKGLIDLFEDEPISITYSISDVKDISKRNSSYSQTFTIPASKNNNILFNHIFNIGSDSSFDPRKKTPAYLLSDSLLIFQGNLQLTKINVKDRNVLSYEVIIYGETADLVKSIGDSYLTDLDFSSLNHTYTVENIINSWTADTATLGYYYPLIDYGMDLTLSDLNNMIPDGTFWNGRLRTTGGIDPTVFKPALSNKYLLDKIISEAGFSYESTFLNSSAFTQTIIPYNGDDKTVYGAEYMEQFLFQAGMTDDVSFTAMTTNPYYYNPTYGRLVDYLIKFNNDSTNGNFDISNNYNTSTYKYTSTLTSVQQFFTRFNVEFTFTGTSFNSVGDVHVYWCRKMPSQAAIVFHNQQIWLPNTKTSGEQILINSSTPILNDPNSTTLYPVQANEEIFMVATIFCGMASDGRDIYTTIRAFDSQLYNKAFPDLVPNGLLFYNNFIPKNVKQIDVLKSYINMFNLFVIPSKENEKHLLIEPRQDYFASGTIKNWTSKLDVSQGIEETLISETQLKQILFTYKEDKDYLNTLYKDKTQTIYGQYIQNIDNEWLDAKSQQRVESSFSPSPLENVVDSDNIILTKIGKLDSNGAFGKTEHNIRFLRKNKTPLTIPNGDTIRMVGYSARTSYPYAGHLSTPFSDDRNPLDYNFGQIEQAFYTSPNSTTLQSLTPNNLTYVYWRDYLTDISDKDSKLIKCKIKLTPADIAAFKYNDSIYLEGLTDDGGHYFIVNKLTYSPTSSEPSTVELIKTDRKPLQVKTPSKKVVKQEKAIKQNAIALGGSQTFSPNVFTSGSGTYVSPTSPHNIAIGKNVTIGKNSSYNYVSGSNIVLSDNVQNSYVSGNNLRVGNPDPTTASTSTNLVLSGVTILGVNNYTATTSDTLYVPNIQLTSTASTINGLNINTILSGSSVWSSGSGTYSIKAVNDTTLIASGQYSYAEGYQTTASGEAAHAEGESTTASGDYGSHAEGFSTTASGWFSHSENQNTLASGQAAHAEGYYATANGFSSHAEGNYTIASGSYGAHAEGAQTIAAGDASHAEGYKTGAYGQGSHAEGGYPAGFTSGGTAIGAASHAGGLLTIASGETSFVHGTSSQAHGISTIVLGDNITGVANNTVYVPNFVLTPTITTPSGTTDTIGEVGQITYDASYLYLKTVSGWTRTTLSTF